ncbi:hypothetical protein Hsc_3809 [Herbaspirillum seropedicae]|nr:hypothetical protein Hsc_3809 [Herbaspirillum seropedicae]
MKLIGGNRNLLIRQAWAISRRCDLAPLFWQAGACAGPERQNHRESAPGRLLMVEILVVGHGTELTIAHTYTRTSDWAP